MERFLFCAGLPITYGEAAGITRPSGGCQNSGATAVDHAATATLHHGKTLPFPAPRFSVMTNPAFPSLTITPDLVEAAKASKAWPFE
ncbi:MAG: hypothetical protein AAGK38_05860, partial [Pseudomonadota bacterium]